MGLIQEKKKKSLKVTAAFTLALSLKLASGKMAKTLIMYTTILIT